MKLRAAVMVSTLLGLSVFVVPAPASAQGSLSLNISQGTVGTQVSIPAACNYGTGVYQIYWDETDQIIGQGEITKACGAINFIVPEATRGKHKVTLKVASDYFATEFTVMPSISLSADTGTVGSTLTVVGRGFNSNESGIRIIYTAMSPAFASSTMAPPWRPASLLAVKGAGR